MPPAPRESVWLYTLHKAASTLFAEFVLGRVVGLQHVDFASAIFRGADSGAISFEPNGFVYGPIRVSAVPGTRVHAELVTPCTRDEFVRDRIAVFLVRDPRDILVSGYHSFGFTHPLSPVPELRAKQEARRVEIQSQSIDGYALAQAPTTAAHFATIARLRAACRRGVLLRYEDMIHDWPTFERDLTVHLPLPRGVLDEMRERVRPKEVEDVTAHRRSGATGDHRTKLRDETIRALDATLGPTLREFGYESERSLEPVAR